MHEKLGGYIALPSAANVNVMQGYGEFRPMAMWPYSHEAAQSYNGAWVRAACDMTHAHGMEGGVALLCRSGS